MFRNQYDSDCITFSPHGRLFQVEYALEAIKQGSAAVGLVSKTHAALVALKRNAEELGSYQKKILKIDDHVGIALAALSPDARVLGNFMRQQAMSSKMIYDRPISVLRLIHAIGDKAQTNTQMYGGRPYGVGLLVVGYDETGPHLWEFLPSGSILEYVGAAIGARSQSARTYLERKFEEFADCTSEQLILQGLSALRDCLPQDKELTFENTSIAIVGKDQPFKIIDNLDVKEWLEKLGDTTSTRTRRHDEAAAAAAAETEPTTTGTTATGENASGGNSSSTDNAQITPPEEETMDTGA